MSATDELRRLLDGRGIEYCGGEIMTYTDDAEYMPSENNTFDVTLYHLTPEQAVEATLGSDLKAENEKLRELVRNVEHYERFGCQGCPHSGSCGSGTLYDEDCAMSREIERGKRELGVEVDV
jgi:hypothetical protein